MRMIFLRFGFASSAGSRPRSAGTIGSGRSRRGRLEAPVRRRTGGVSNEARIREIGGRTPLFFSPSSVFFFGFFSID